MPRHRRRRYLPLVPLQLSAPPERPKKEEKRMQGFLDFAYAAKAWAAGFVVAVGNASSPS